jgi:FkbM family methyltransferase
VTTLRQYVTELWFCFHIGVDLRTKLTLAINTLCFHFFNAPLLRAHRVRSGAPTRYLVHIAGESRPLWMRTLSGDIFVFHEVLLGKIYELSVSLVSRPQSIVDLGANIGLATLFFYERFGAATYVCVEPDPENIKLLNRNLAGLRGHIRILPSAVSDVPGTVRFNPSQWSWGGRLDPSSTTGYDVQCTTMSEILNTCGLDHIDLLKVDVESSVESIFRKNNDWLAKVDAIIAELWPGYGADEFASDVGRFGFRVIRHGEATVTAVRAAP